MSLGKMEMTILLAIYAAVLIYSTYCLFGIFSNEQGSEGNSPSSLLILVYAALSGASAFYSRKLYKAGINGDYSFEPNREYIKRLSTFSYFILRLPLSVIFALILYSVWRLSIDVASEVPYAASDKAKYVYLLIGFFSGFSSGRIIEHFERSGFQIATTAGHPK